MAKSQPKFFPVFGSRWKEVSRQQAAEALRAHRAAGTVILLYRPGWYRLLGNWEWITLRTR